MLEVFLLCLKTTLTNIYKNVKDIRRFVITILFAKIQFVNIKTSFFYFVYKV